MFVIYLIGIAIGLFMIATAVFNWDTWFYDVESVVIETIGGETAVRWYWGICGLGLIVAIATHWIWGWWPSWF